MAPYLPQPQGFVAGWEGASNSWFPSVPRIVPIDHNSSVHLLLESGDQTMVPGQQG